MQNPCPQYHHTHCITNTTQPTNITDMSLQSLIVTYVLPHHSTVLNIGPGLPMSLIACIRGHKHRYGHYVVLCSARSDILPTDVLLLNKINVTQCHHASQSLITACTPQCYPAVLNVSPWSPNATLHPHLLPLNETNATQCHPASLSMLPVPLNSPAHQWDIYTPTQLLSL